MIININIDIALIITLCIFTFLMYVAYRVGRYLDYEQRHNKVNSLTINTIPEQKMNDIKLKEWDN